MTNRGVIYCATTHDRYLESALISAMALRQLDPALPVTIISDRPLLQQFPVSDYGITPRLVDPNEVGDYCYQSPGEIKSSMLSHPNHFTEWFKIAFPKLEAYLTASY